MRRPRCNSLHSSSSSVLFTAACRLFSFGVELLPPPPPLSFTGAVGRLRARGPSHYIIPMKAAYFNDCGQSGIQSAVDYLQRVAAGESRVVLTVTSTMCVDNNINNNNNEDENTSATRDGVRRVLRDFLVRCGGNSLLVLRGDDRRRRKNNNNNNINNNINNEKTCCGEFHGSVDLLRFVAAEAKVLTDTPVLLLASGYPQGHPTQRTWNNNINNNINKDNNRDNNNNKSTSPSFSSNTATVSVRLQALINQINSALTLRDVPSVLTNEAAQTSVGTLVREKIIRCGVRGVVTQMLTSADEFSAYIETIHRELHNINNINNNNNNNNNNKVSAGEIMKEIMFFPSVMAPLPAEDYTRVLLLTRVIPSHRVQEALRAYRDGLLQLLTTTRAAGGNNSKEEEEVFINRKKKELDDVFEGTLEEETVELCRGIMQTGDWRFHFSAFNNNHVGRLLRLLDRLEEKE